MKKSSEVELRPSSAARWMSCAGSVAASRGGSSESSPAARLGTVAHGMAAIALISREAVEILYPPGEPVYVDGEEVSVTEEMCAIAQKYVDYVGGYMTDSLNLIHVEKEVPIHTWTGEPGATGTADALILTWDARRLVVVDFKSGRVPVPAERNPQLSLYGLGALELFGDEAAGVCEIELVIVQPLGGGVDSWICSREALVEFGAEVKRAAARIRDTPHAFSPGAAQCKWCPSSGACAAQTQWVLTAVCDDYVDPQHAITPHITEPTALDEGALANALDAVELVEGWCRGVKAKAFECLGLRGEGPLSRRYKLVLGNRRPAKWLDEEAAERMLAKARLKKGERYVSKLISPAQAEKLLKGTPQVERIGALSERPRQGVVIAPVGDKRPAASEPDFDTFDNEE